MLTRRRFIETASLSLIALLTPFQAVAAWASQAFKANSLDAAYLQLFNSTSFTTTRKIQIVTPQTAKNSNAVPIKVSANVPNVQSISIFIETANSPLVATFQLSAATTPFVSTRIKMVKTDVLIVVVKTAEKLYTNRKKISLIKNHCGS